MIELSGQTYLCSAGETFDSIALSIYGDEEYTAELLFANPKYCEKMVFTGGEILELPVVVVPDEDLENDYAPPYAPWRE